MSNPKSINSLITMFDSERLDNHNSSQLHYKKDWNFLSIHVYWQQALSPGSYV